MYTRIDFRKVDPNAMQAMLNLGGNDGLEESLLDLIKVRASQINRCAFCLDMHIKDARASGETEQRLYSLDVWHEVSYYSERERAALTWTEALTRLGENGVPDEVFEKVRQHFTDEEMVKLTMTVIAINSWNRINIGLHTTVPGHYKSRRQPRQEAAQAG
jgi:AhpD family alkylhydroperoxidase